MSEAQQGEKPGSKVFDRPGGKNKQGRIGFFVAEALEAVYREIAGLLGIAWINAPLEGVPNFDTPTDEGKNSVSEKASDYDVILVDGISIEHLSKLISEDSDQRGSGQPNREKPKP